ncbi:MAG: NADPH-dependent F420 reductase [Syntrophomonadaceae bacterium]
MNVTIIGTGNMAEGISTRLLSGGNNVTFVGHKDKEADSLVSRLTSQASKGSSVKASSPGSSIQDDVVVLAIPFEAANSVLRDYGQQLQGKIVVDITNPLNQNYDALVTKPGTSAAEELQKLLPGGAKLVKAFNTTFAGTLKKGEVAGQKLDVFIAGDDPQTKKTISGLIESGNMRPIDAGPLQRARELEGIGLLVITLQGTLKTNFMSAIKILS